jgi:hypothetical protein
MLKYLLVDKTTKENIIFATDVYYTKDYPVFATDQITVDVINWSSVDIQPRVAKSRSEQSKRTRKNAEVFTPSWICNKMNNHCDDEWFGKTNVFNFEQEQSWTVNKNKIEFSDNKTWQDYVESKRIEITCGEAPYVVSRYDTSTGDIIDIDKRIGILDRKLRVVGENTDNEEDWLKWTKKAYQSVYGYEYQGDNLLIARVNLLNTFVDYMVDKWNRKPDKKELKAITNIIVWNFWQMDGITCAVPFKEVLEDEEQFSFFDIIDNLEKVDYSCRIYDWKANKSIKFSSIKKG